jgi:hypothetical protein
MQSVFVIQTRFSHVYYSVRSDENSTKPCIVAFEQKKDARQLQKMIVNMQCKSKPHQQLQIRTVPSKSLMTTCTLSHLDILLFREQGKSDHIDVPSAHISDYRDSFEGCM